MRVFCLPLIGMGLIVVLAAGCATSGGGQLENTVYDTHRRVVKLEQDLGGSVEKLNETAADLTARVDQNDQQTRTLQSTIEENQVKLDALQRTLENLSSTLYRSLNLTAPSGSSGFSSEGTQSRRSEVDMEGPVVVTPAPTAPPVSSPRPEVLPPVSSEPTVVPPASTPAPSPAAEAGAAVGGSPEDAYQQAQQSFADENYEVALQQFDDYLKRYPNVDADFSANAQFWKGYCCYNLGKQEQAIEEFKTLRTSYPNSSKIPFGIYIQAMAYKQLGQTARAIELLKDVVNNYPVNTASERAKTELEKLQGR